MRTVTQKIYTIGELSKDAQERAHAQYLEGIDYFWGDEWKESMEEFCKLFPVKVTDYEISTGSPTFAHIDLTCSDEIADFSGDALRVYLMQNFKETIEAKDGCPFTGYCGDESLLTPIRQFLKAKTRNDTMRELMQECLDTWAADWKADMENQESMEYFKEHAEANDYEFLRDGSDANTLGSRTEPDFYRLLKDLVEAVDLKKLNVKKDFSLMNAHACANKALHEFVQYKA